MYNMPLKLFKDLVGREVEQLPKTTSAPYMRLVKLTTTDFIINEENTLHSDGTLTKIWPMTSKKKKMMALSWLDSDQFGGWVAQTQLNTLKETVTDWESIGDNNYFVNKNFFFNQKFKARLLCHSKKV